MANEKKRKRKRLKIIVLFELILILCILSIAWVYFTLGKVNQQEWNKDDITINQFKDSNISDYRNFAIFGIDSRANELEKSTRSDSIMIVSIHRRTKAVKLLSIYRDTFASIDDHGYTKINHAYFYGGPALAVSTLNKNFDLNITDFITVNFSALTHVIDSLGGITLNIKKEELKYVNAYTRDVAKINGTSFEYLEKAGKQVLDGTQATAYARVRYTAGGDFTRAERQRNVVAAIIAKAKKTNPIQLNSVFNDMLPQVSTNMNAKSLMTMSLSLFFYSLKDQSGFPFEQESKKIKGASVVIPTTLSKNVVEMHEFLFGTSNFEPSDTVTKISSEMAKN